jgi:nucleotide-binding universal stress UspA family protein
VFYSFEREIKKTKVMKNILIALDYDPTAEKIAEIGYELAKPLNARITLLHVISNEVYYSSRIYSPIMGFTGFTPTEPLESERTEYLKEAAVNYLQKSRDHLGDSNINTLVREGDFADTIIKTAVEINADVIVMGTHSRRWLEKIVMGSVTEEVLKSSTIPLLIVPTKKEDNDD